MKQIPERNGAAFATQQNVATLPPDYLIDGSERRRQRPKNAEKQRDTYSGKKAHTDKNVILANVHNQRVDNLSQNYDGKTHDKKVADQESIHYPHHATLTQDTGFQGMHRKEF